MKRFKEIFTKNILAFEKADCEQCDEKEGCDHIPTEELIMSSMDETDPDNKELKVLFDSIREWYKEKTGQELND